MPKTNSVAKRIHNQDQEETTRRNKQNHEHNRLTSGKLL